MSEYIVIYEQAEDGGWGAYIPDLPGVVALGTTRAEVAERIQEAISAYANAARRCHRRTTRQELSPPELTSLKADKCRRGRRRH
jgi:predicted RNase H-like HicB family nuclease